ncbi:hypothetical protein QEN19_001092 [Hanseniaspora menglaensis]
MSLENKDNTLSIGFIVYLITQVLTFLCLGYILIYYPINNLFCWKKFDELEASKLLSSYIFPQGFWIIFGPSLILVCLVFIYIFIPLYNENIILQASNTEYSKSLLYVDNKGKLYAKNDLDTELPGVEDILLFKINQRLYRDKTKVFNDDPDWIVEDIYI